MQELGRIEKGWGFEIVWTNNDQYCGKLLVFNKPGAKTSMIYHKDRKKSWFVNEGRFKLVYCNTKTGEYHEANLETGAAFEVNALVPHQLESLEPDSLIFEVSIEGAVVIEVFSVTGTAGVVISEALPLNKL